MVNDFIRECPFAQALLLKCVVVETRDARYRHNCCSTKLNAGPSTFFVSLDGKSLIRSKTTSALRRSLRYPAFGSSQTSVFSPKTRNVHDESRKFVSLVGLRKTTGQTPPTASSTPHIQAPTTRQNLANKAQLQNLDRQPIGRC